MPSSTRTNRSANYLLLFLAIVWCFSILSFWETQASLLFGANGFIKIPAPLFPITVVALLLLVSSFPFFPGGIHQEITLDYASLQAMREMQHKSLLSLLLLPFIGVVSVTILFPAFLSPNTPQPFLAISEALLVYAMASPFLWNESPRWLRPLVGGGLAVLTLGLGVFFGGTKGLFQQLFSDMIRLIPVGLFFLLFLGGFLRWLQKERSLQKNRLAFQRSANLLLFLVGLGQILLLIQPNTFALMKPLAWTLAVFLVGAVLVITFLLLRHLRTLWQCHRTLPFFLFRPYLLIFSLPFALLFALIGWLWGDAPSVLSLLLLIGAQILSFSSLSTLYIRYHSQFSHPNPVWMFLRPVLLFVFIFFPLVFPALSLFNALKSL